MTMLDYILWNPDIAAFHIGSFAVRWYSICWCFALFSGYIIVQQAAHSPMFGGKKPDATGVYRALKRMEEAELVTSEWETPEEGSAKRLFTLTDKGRRCLRRWIDALACYELTLEELRAQAAQALGIDLPDAPVCSHE